MNYKYLYGPIASRRLGNSLGISPIPNKTCNYSCIYCQLGDTNHFTNTKEYFFPLEDIISEFKEVMNQNLHIDVVSIVGDGEPTLYQGLGELITTLKTLTNKPICVITNGALLNNNLVQDDLLNADIIMPSINAYNEALFKKVNRPFKGITFKDTYDGLVNFSHKFKGKLWIEIMLLDGINDQDYDLQQFKEMLAKINYDRLYLNTVVRPPALSNVKMVSKDRMQKAVEVLGGISIDLLSTSTYQSTISDDYEAIISNIMRHPMNKFEIEAFLKSRNVNKIEDIFKRLDNDDMINKIEYKGIITYRLK